MTSARIKSIGRAAALMDAMASGRWMALRELAAATGMAKTTVYNLVNALVDTGFVERRSEDSTYRLGLLHLIYGRAVERRLDIVATIRPHLVRLCAETRETVNLALPCPTDAIIVESLEGSQTLRVSSYAGTRAAYHTTACGRALLAWQDEASRSAVLGLGLGPLPSATPRTVTDMTRLEALLERCRTRGWASELEENEVGSACVAAPIFDARGTAIASVSVAGPAARFGKATMNEMGTMLAARMTEVSALLKRTASAPLPAITAEATT